MGTDLCRWTSIGSGIILAGATVTNDNVMAHIVISGVTMTWLLYALHRWLPWPFRQRGQHEHRAQSRWSRWTAGAGTGTDGYAH